ncbi:MAG: hypothetical protein JWM19_5243, partial [Actinomycetia bacterium]|nr:hypothetical protein [Actinomycetes bacterium]
HLLAQGTYSEGAVFPVNRCRSGAWWSATVPDLTRKIATNAPTLDVCSAVEQEPDHQGAPGIGGARKVGTGSRK